MKFFTLVLFLLATCLANGNTIKEADLLSVMSPKIVGDTLYIQGKIDSHIYDFLAHEYEAVKAVEFVSLNSYGGSAGYGMEIGQKILELEKKTIIKKGHVCASACTYIFASGVERIMEEDTWLGLHGARLGESQITSFRIACFIPQDDGTSVFDDSSTLCKSNLKFWEKIALNMTNESFDFMEKAGVSPYLR